MTNTWEDLRRAKEEEYFKKHNHQALAKLTKANSEETEAVEDKEEQREPWHKRILCALRTLIRPGRSRTGSTSPAEASSTNKAESAAETE